MEAFGGPVQLFRGDGVDGTSSTTAGENMDLVRRLLTDLNDGGEGCLRIYRPQPTAAFSPRDTTLSAYERAADAMRARGFVPVERRAGGQLAVYDQSTLIIDLVAQHANPRQDVTERFRQFAGAIATAMQSFSIDARVGSIPGEYCPGDYSVNAGGRIKLAGIAQRIGRRGYHLGAVIGIETSAAVKDSVTEAYRLLDYDFDSHSLGTVDDAAPGAGFIATREALLHVMTNLVQVIGGEPNLGSAAVNDL